MGPTFWTFLICIYSRNLSLFVTHSSLNSSFTLADAHSVVVIVSSFLFIVIVIVTVIIIISRIVLPHYTLSPTQNSHHSSSFTKPFPSPLHSLLIKTIITLQLQVYIYLSLSLQPFFFFLFNFNFLFLKIF